MSDDFNTPIWFDTPGHLTADALGHLLEGDAHAFPGYEQARSHINSCNACALKLEQARQTVALLHDLPVQEPGRSFLIEAPRSSVMASPGRRQRIGPVFSPSLPLMRVAVAVLVMLLAGVTAGDLWTNRDEPSGDLAFIAETTPPTGAIETQAAPAAELPSASGGGVMATMPADEARQSDAPLQQSEAEADASTSDAPSILAQESSLAPAAEATVFAEATNSAAEQEPVEEEVSAKSGSDGLTGWRKAEIGLLIALAWLVVTWMGLERMKQSGEH